MNMLKGERAMKFVKWLNGAKEYLPPRMMLTEAQELFERKEKEEEDNARKNTNSKGGSGATSFSNVVKFPPNCS
jgi:hypothetical protein